MQNVKDIPEEVLPPADLLELLNPVDPDKLQHVGDGVYEAQWSLQNTGRFADLDILAITPAVKLIGTTFEPEGLPGWTAVRFTYTQQPEVEDPHVETMNGELENQYELPPLPTDVHLYGEQIELVKNTLHELNRKLSQAKELMAVRKESITREANNDSANTNDVKRKTAAAAMLAQDHLYQQTAQNILWLTDLVVVWDARRSRLNRDFEIARIDYGRSSASSGCALYELLIAAREAEQLLTLMFNGEMDSNYTCDCEGPNETYPQGFICHNCEVRHALQAAIESCQKRLQLS